MSETGKEKGVSRRQFLKGATAVGINALLVSCGVSPVEEERRRAIKNTEEHLKAATAHSKLMEQIDSSVGEEQEAARGTEQPEEQRESLEEQKEKVNRALRDLGEENVKPLLVKQVIPGGAFRVTVKEGVNRRRLPSNMAEKVGALQFDSQIKFSNLYINDQQVWGKSAGKTFSCVGQLDPESGQMDTYMEKIASEPQ